MSEPAKALKEEHKEDGGGSSPKEYIVFALWAIVIMVTILVSFIIVIVNQETAQNFIYFLNGIEIFLGLYFLFLAFKLYGYIKKFEHQTEHLEHMGHHRYTPPKVNNEPKSPLQLRFNKAKAHIGSNYQEEWKIGVIELDTILRDLLKAKYKGDIVADLLKDAESKGFQSTTAAWEAHKVRNKIVHEGIKYEMDKSFAEKVLRNYTTVFNELGI